MSLPENSAFISRGENRKIRTGLRPLHKKVSRLMAAARLSVRATNTEKRNIFDDMKKNDYNNLLIDICLPVFIA